MLRDLTGQESLSRSKTGCGTEGYNIMKVCNVPFRGTKWDKAEKDVLRQENVILKNRKGHSKTGKDVLK